MRWICCWHATKNSEGRLGKEAQPTLTRYKKMKAFPTYTYDGKDYSLPYELPAGKSGKLKVVIEFKPAGSKLPVVSMRNALFMGLKPAQLLLDRPLGIHFLREDGVGTWMTSMPQEIEQISRQLLRAHGRVLVGGLGLGLANCYLDANPLVKQVICIEKNKNIIDLIKPHVPRDKSSIFHGDLYEYLKSEPPCFDFAFYDIWCPTGERVLTEHVMPLRRLSRNIVAQDNIECWNEEEMLGQVKMGAQMACQWMDEADKKIGGARLLDLPEKDFNQYKKAQGFVWYFYRWLRRRKPTAEQGLAKCEEFMKALKDPEKFDKDWAWAE